MNKEQYEVVGFILDNNKTVGKIGPGLVVPSYEAAHNLFKEAGIKNYLIELRKI